MKANLLWSVVALAIMFILGIEWDIKPKWLQLASLHREKNHLMHRFAEESILIKKESDIKKRMALLSQTPLPFRCGNNTIVGAELFAIVFRAGELSGLILESVEPQHWQMMSGFNTVILQLFVDGKFSQFAEFLDVLNHYTLPIVLTDFNLHSQGNGQLQIKLKLMSGYFSSQPSVCANTNNHWRSASLRVFNIQQDPFVSSRMLGSDFELNNHQENYDFLIRSISLRQLKWAGYIQQGKRCWAFVKLPNQKTIDITENSILGMEGARVVNINEQQLIVELKGRQFVIK